MKAYVPSSLRRLVRCGLLCTGTVLACSSDDDTPAPQPNFTIAVASLDGVSPDETVPLRCDGTLAVTVTIATSIPRVEFVLSPQGACGESKRCGYVQAEGLDAEGTAYGPLAKSVTTTAVLELDNGQLASLSGVRVKLISGVDGNPVLNEEGEEVSAVVTPPFTLPTGCDEGGGTGGAAGADSGGAPSLGGAGAGAGGAGGAPSLGGAGAGGGSMALGGAGAGGGAGADSIALGGAGAGTTPDP